MLQKIRNTDDAEWQKLQHTRPKDNLYVATRKAIADHQTSGPIVQVFKTERTFIVEGDYVHGDGGIDGLHFVRLYTVR